MMKRYLYVGGPAAAFIAGVLVVLYAAVSGAGQAQQTAIVIAAGSGAFNVPDSPCDGEMPTTGSANLPRVDEVQAKNAREIAKAVVAAAAKQGYDPAQTRDALTIALAASLVEADLRNLPSASNPSSLDFDYDLYADGSVPVGDLDSVGLFQQRDAWGPMSVRMDRQGSAGMFVNGGRAGQRGLFDFDWQRMSPGAAAQRVQVSAYPTRYSERIARARAIATTLLGDAAPAANCPDDGQDVPGVGKCPAYSTPLARGLTPDARLNLFCTHEAYPQITSVGCLARGGHVAASDHYTGRACDYMIPGQLDGRDTPAGVALGDAVAAFQVQHARALGVKYVIWHGQIWNAARASEGWRPYRHPSGSSNWTLQHMDHVHVSVYGQSGTTGWNRA